MKVAQYEVVGRVFSKATRPYKGRSTKKLTIAELHPRRKAERFCRPRRDGRVFVRHFPAQKCLATFVRSLRD